MIKLMELLFLAEIRGFGKVKVNKYLDTVKETDDFEALYTTIMEKTGLPEDALISARTAAKQSYDELMQQEDLKVITVFDQDYPQGCLSLGDKKPLIFYVKGDTSILNRPAISVVGTRSPSSWTRLFGMNISKQMGYISGRVIVSGLALGCDEFAHKGALLAKVPTVAVLPSGVNTIIPSSHKDLASEIIKSGGCLISEYPPNAGAFRTTFVERDSIIAAMTGITYVIECAEKSGTMHTVDAAYKMGRKLACYYPDQESLEKGAKEADYLGNKKMIDQLGATVVAKQEDLQAFFEAKA